MKWCRNSKLIQASTLGYICNSYFKEIFKDSYTRNKLSFKRWDLLFMFWKPCVWPISLPLGHTAMPLSLIELQPTPFTYVSLYFVYCKRGDFLCLIRTLFNFILVYDSRNRDKKSFAYIFLKTITDTVWKDVLVYDLRNREEKSCAYIFLKTSTESCDYVVLDKTDFR